MQFDYQPVLQGNLVALRPLQAEDFDALYRVASDPLIWEQHPDSNRHQEAKFRAFFDDALQSGGALIAEEVSAQRVIGSSRFHGYNQAKSEVEIGWTFLARSHWGGLYNAEMKHLMLSHAFQYVDSVVFLVGPDNLRSQRALEKIGARREGTRPDVRGAESILYRMTAPAFRGRQ